MSRRPRRLDVKRVERLLRVDPETLRMLENISTGRNVPRNAGAIVRSIGLRLKYTQPEPAVRVANADGGPLSIRVDLTAALEPKILEVRNDPAYPVPVKVLAPGPKTRAELRGLNRSYSEDEELAVLPEEVTPAKAPRVAKKKPMDPLDALEIQEPIEPAEPMGKDEL